MKHNLLVLTVFESMFLITTTVQAQNATSASIATPLSSQIELRVSGGYGFAKGGNPMSDYNLTYDSTTDWSGTTASISKGEVNDKYFSFGQGIRFEASLIYFIQDNFGLLLGSGYSQGKESAVSTETDNYYLYYSSSSSYTYTRRQSISFGYIPVIVGVYFKTANGNVKPYGGAGAGFFIPTKIFSSVAEEFSAPHYKSLEIETETKITTNRPIGYVGYLGISFSLVSSIDLFMEAKATLVSLYLTKTEITKFTVNGADQLATLKTSERVTEYEEDKDYTQNHPINEDQPTFGGPPIPFPGSSIGITVGLSIQL